MISEHAINALCSGKTLERARGVARNDGFIHGRRCDYEPDYTHLHASIEGTGWSDHPYDVNVRLDEADGKILDYECTCPAHSRYPGMCKHAAGLILLFNANPESFKGYSKDALLSTCRSISTLLKKRPSHATGQDTGAIDLLLSIESDRFTRWAASFKIASPSASYVVKDLGELMERIDKGARFEYGKKLAFTHEMSAFTSRAQAVIKMLRKLADTQPDWAKGTELSEKSSGRWAYFGPGGIIELLRLYEGSTVEFTDYKAIGGPEPKDMRVLSEAPVLDMSVQPLGLDGYELFRGAELGFIGFEGAVCGWDDHAFYLCPESWGPCQDFLSQVYCNGEERLIISEGDMPLFCAAVLPRLERIANMEIPQQVADLRPVEGAVSFFLDITAKGCECEAKAVYGSHELNLFEPGNKPGMPVRDEALEGAARAVCTAYFPSMLDERTALADDDDSLARLVFHGIAELQRLGEVYSTDGVKRLKSAVKPRIETGLSLQGNLIDMRISSQDMDPDEVAMLLASYRAKKRYHRLKDGSFVSLEGADGKGSGLDALSALAEELGLTNRQLAKQQVSLQAHHAFLLDELFEEEAKDESFTSFIENFASGAAAGSHEVPASLAETMRSYQKEGFLWLNTLADMGLGGILADEMGLGKSLQSIALLLHRKEELEQKRALIVCPASLVYNWASEFKKFAPELVVRTLAGTRENRNAVRAEEGVHVLVTSYDILRIDAAAMAASEFSFLIIDEAQYIKNHATASAKAVKQVAAEHRVALTGTPIENRLSELWSIFDFLAPGMLGAYRRFRDLYEQPILDGDEEMAQHLRAKVGPFILRRLKSDVLTDLPEKLENVVQAQLDEEQRALYDAHEQHLRTELAKSSDDQISNSKIAVLAELTKLRQLCCDPRLLFSNYEAGSAKLDVIAELLESAVESGQKVLVFSQFTSFLELIAARVESLGFSYYQITGSTPKKKRMDLVNAFNADDVPVFLISLKAGGTGLNLTGASIVIHADPWWNAAAQNQATDRAHRIGQTRDVSVFKVIASGTIEERIVALQEAKSDLADQVLAADGASLAQMSRDDLISLLTSD